MGNCGKTVCRGGGLASGKTAIARRVAALTGGKYASFGQLVAVKAGRCKSTPFARATRQERGESLIHADVRGLCSDLLAAVRWSSGESIIVDGVRHWEAYQCLRELTAPADAVLV